MPIIGLDHIQLAIPPNSEDTARGFYGQILGFREVPKPDNLIKRGGCWFEHGAIKLHLGTEHSFSPALKAHPAFLIDDLAAFLKILAKHDIPITEDEPLAGYLRAYIQDPFGNRIELMQKL
ncbi:VOC family protein [Pseudochrobactrum sp. HB0163]|uniref:VOC family protein n=1 Tax=Pseudochrobactrum sp. HB0163 TaxID=3450708 RepID=UPI003F6E3B36